MTIHFTRKRKNRENMWKCDFNEFKSRLRLETSVKLQCFTESFKLQKQQYNLKILSVKSKATRENIRLIAKSSFIHNTKHTTGLNV